MPGGKRGAEPERREEEELEEENDEEEEGRGKWKRRTRNIYQDNQRSNEENAFSHD